MANEQFIRNRRGTLLTTILPGKTQNVSTLVLHGYGAPEYGQLRDNNLVYLLENFYSETPPANPVEGQLWWKTNDQLYVWTLTGSPSSGIWDNVVPAGDALGFEIVAGGGLTGGGFPTSSPAEVVLVVGAGSGINYGSPGDGSPQGFLHVDESDIDHDSLLDFVADEHVGHSTVTLTAGDGMTGGGDITASREFNIGQGDGLVVSDDAVAVDTSVLLVGSPDQTTTGNYVVSGSQIRGYSGTGSPKMAYTFTSDTSTGLYRDGGDTIVFAVQDREAFRINSSGVMVYNTGSPISHPSNDDDIVTKGYVDSLSGSGTSPTETTFGPGVDTLSGLTAGKIYQITAYGIQRDKGNSTATLSQVTVRDGGTVGSGTILPSPIGAGSPVFTPASAFTNGISINWPDGNAPLQATFIVKALSTELNVETSPTSTPQGSIYLIGVELGDG